MYQLYYSPQACSLAIHTILNELSLPVAIIDRAQVEDFSRINPTGAVPVLAEGDDVFTEGAAMILHLLEKHPNPFLPDDAKSRQRLVEDLMFANATMHPAYSKLFFFGGAIEESEQKQQLLIAGANQVSQLWRIVDERLADKPFLGGQQYSPADILLAVYSRWGAFFDVDIQLGANAQAMVDRIIALPSFRQALADQEANTAAIAA